MFSRLSINSHDSSERPSPLTSSSSASSLLGGANLSINTAVEPLEAPSYAIACVNGLSSAGLFEDAAVIAQGYLHENPNHALLLKHLAKGLFEREHYSEASQIYQRLEAMSGLASDVEKKLCTIEALLNDHRPGAALDIFLRNQSLEECAKGLYFQSRALRKLKQPAAAKVAVDRMVGIAGEKIIDDFWIEYGLVLYDLHIEPYIDGTFEIPHAEIYHRRAELWKGTKTSLYENYLFKYAEIIKSPGEFISVAKVLRSNQKTDGINTISYKERAERADRLYYEALHSPKYSPTHAPQKTAQVYGWRVDNLAYGDIDPARQERFLRQKMELDGNSDRLLNFIGKAGGRDYEILQLLEIAERRFGGKYIALAKDQRKYVKNLEKIRKANAKKISDDTHKHDPVQRSIKQTRVAAGWHAWKAQK